MNKEIKEKWLAALRSGQYVQGQNHLHSLEDGQHKFCCLGVLCDIMGEEWAEQEGTQVFETSKGESGGLSLATYDSLGIWGTVRRDIPGRSSIDESIPYHLMAFNDGVAVGEERAWTFEEIADWIEENIPEDN